ncbi:MAG TPA: HAMP domain-containing sensor histidine kinase [Bacteroidota bacterium]|nr:HAMP domain-containing sensor histidine kinase [Bacteroidota bacterium]
MKVLNLLAFRVFLIILFVMLVGTAVLTKLSIDHQAEQYLRDAIVGANRIGDVIKRSTNYSMMLNRREDIHQIINTIGNEPGIEAIRIYNKKGEITLSTVPGEVGTNVDMTAEACTACHSPGKAPLSPNPRELSRIFSSPKGYRVLGMIVPIKNDSTCSTADCHAHAPSQTILGVLDVMMPLKEIDEHLAGLNRSQYWNALFMFFVMTSFVGVFIWLVVNIPVHKLTLGTHEITKGNLDYRISVRSADEIGRLATSFNQMADELKRARNELTEWAQTLEGRVAQKTEELKRAQANMIQMEKMVSLGKLASTVAHELNNPLEGVLTYAKLLKKMVKEGMISGEEAAEIQSDLTIIADETARCGNIVKNLLLFSRQKVGDFVETDIRGTIERTVSLIDHHLKIHNIALETDFQREPLMLVCDPQQIEQAVLAVEINAIEAMPEGGALKIEARHSADAIDITVTDTGIGISDNALPHIFEPFFTTKENGKGTGLGLAVVYGIIERHGGTIDVQSKLHGGTTFVLHLPRTASRNVNTGSSSSLTLDNGHERQIS